MQPLRIVFQSGLLLFTNIRQALIATALPLVVALGMFALFIATGAVPLHWSLWGAADAATIALGVAAALLGVSAILVGFLSWHRALMTGEPARLLPQIPRRVLRSYLTVVGQICVIVIPVMIAFAFLLQAVVMLLNPDLEMRGSIVIGYIGGALMNMLLIRLGIALSGAAMGDNRPLARSWVATGGITFTLLLLSLLYVALSLVEMPDILPPAVALVVHFILGWLQPLFWIAVLTTLWKQKVAPQT